MAAKGPAVPPPHTTTSYSCAGGATGAGAAASVGSTAGRSGSACRICSAARCPHRMRSARVATGSPVHGPAAKRFLAAGCAAPGSAPLAACRGNDSLATWVTTPAMSSAPSRSARSRSGAARLASRTSGLGMSNSTTTSPSHTPGLSTTLAAPPTVPRACGSDRLLTRLMVITCRASVLHGGSSAAPASRHRMPASVASTKACAWTMWLPVLPATTTQVAMSPATRTDSGCA